MNLALRCVNCKHALVFQDNVWLCASCNSSYQVEDGIPVFWSKEMSALAQEEAKYHDHFEEDAREVHQLECWRNQKYHQMVWRAMSELCQGSLLLEIGTGSGYDARHLKGYQLVLSDISPKTLTRTRNNLKDDSAQFFAFSGDSIPFNDAVFNGVYMVATLHHFENPELTVKEVWRVLKPGGKLTIGIEPNAFYFKLIKRFRKLLCFFTHTPSEEGSKADAEMEGFSYHQLARLFSDNNWNGLSIYPMWLLNGFVHYGLEFSFRAFHLKKRLSLPVALEKILVALDEAILRLPGLKHLCWHWIIQVNKSDA